MTGRAEISLWITQWFESSSGENIDLEENFFEAGLIDSFGVIELVEEIENEFNIKFDQIDFQNRGFPTISGLSVIIEDKIAS
tara:strand:+ start:23459 stop:23704 length:246 start_codon:yes stop_codon:yes gene_type:complete